jgi:hypothetical protein
LRTARKPPVVEPRRLLSAIFVPFRSPGSSYCPLKTDSTPQAHSREATARFGNISEGPRRVGIAAHGGGIAFAVCAPTSATPQGTKQVSRIRSHVSERAGHGTRDMENDICWRGEDRMAGWAIPCPRSVVRYEVRLESGCGDEATDTEGY